MSQEQTFTLNTEEELRVEVDWGKQIELQVDSFHLHFIVTIFT